MQNSKRRLKILAALVWYIGGFILFFKGISLIQEAVELRPELLWHWLGLGIGFGLGTLKAVYIFKKSIYKNMDRIEGLEEPKIWNFYSGKFFIALALMIATGVTLSRASHGIYGMLIPVGALDLSLSIALIGSSYIYWKRWK